MPMANIIFITSRSMAPISSLLVLEIPRSLGSVDCSWGLSRKPGTFWAHWRSSEVRCSFMDEMSQLDKEPKIVSSFGLNFTLAARL